MLLQQHISCLIKTSKKTHNFSFSSLHKRDPYLDFYFTCTHVCINFISVIYKNNYMNNNTPVSIYKIHWFYSEFTFKELEISNLNMSLYYHWPLCTYKGIKSYTFFISDTLVLQELHSFVDPLGMTSDGVILNTLPNVLYYAVSKFQVAPFFEMTYSVLETVDGNKQYGIKVHCKTSIKFTKIFSITLLLTYRPCRTLSRYLPQKNNKRKKDILLFFNI